MDVHQFESMSREAQFKYFWEHGIKMDSYKDELHDCYLFLDKSASLYFELSVDRRTEEMDLKAMEHSEAMTRYNGAHITVEKDPWD